MPQSPDSVIVEKWDSDQLSVIAAPPEARLLVEAGPGTGKTAVGCKRIAHLIDEFDISPANLLLVSFTRTAVLELRNRIAGYVGTEARAAGVRISTLDSEAWRFHQGFGEDDQKLVDSYDENIEAVRALLRGNKPELRQYLDRLRHVIVDEAQDLMGVRAQLVLELIEALASDCGVTIFADPAQAIYGFSVEDDSDKEGKDSFLSLLKGDGFVRRSLNKLYRTDSRQLEKLFVDTRSLLSRDDDAGYASLRSTLSDQAAGTIPTAETLRERDDHLLLYRFRRDVLSLSSELCWKGIPHRLRMSRTPACVVPWIGWLFGTCTRQSLDPTGFSSLWQERGMIQRFPNLGCDENYSLLLKTAKGKDGQLDLHLLRRTIARSRPPVELCHPECGTCGPIIGTVHASKGREAPHVILGLPEKNPEQNYSEEMRVLYVGATRSKSSLQTHSARTLYGATLAESGRLWRQLARDNAQDKRRRAQIEFGIEGDIDPFAGVRGDFVFADASERSQLFLADAIGRLLPVVAECKHEWNWEYRLRPESDDTSPLWFGQFRKRVNDDLWEIAKKLAKTHGKTFTPLKIPHLYLFAVSTVAMNPDDPLRSSLNEPYASSGFLLAPVIRAYPVVYFRDGGRK